MNYIFTPKPNLSYLSNMSTFLISHFFLLLPSFSMPKLLFLFFLLFILLWFLLNLWFLFSFSFFMIIEQHNFSNQMTNIGGLIWSNTVIAHQLSMRDRSDIELWGFIKFRIRLVLLSFSVLYLHVFSLISTTDLELGLHFYSLSILDLWIRVAFLFLLNFRSMNFVFDISLYLVVFYLDLWFWIYGLLYFYLHNWNVVDLVKLEINTETSVKLVELGITTI